MDGNRHEPRRVLALIDTYRVSGPCRGLFQLMKYAEPEGHNLIAGMFLSARQTTSPAIEEARRRGLQTAILTQAFRGDPRLVSQALRSSRRYGAHVIQSHNYKPAFLAWRVKRSAGLPWVAFAHGYTNELPRVAFYNRLDRWLMKRADRVVVMSEAMGRAFEDEGVARSRLKVVPNAIDPADYDSGADGGKVREQLEVKMTDVLIGVIGRLSVEKGVTHFLQAFHDVALHVPQAKAVIVGEGPEREGLESWVRRKGLSDRVRFVEYCSPISPVYAAVDLIVIPSLSEGLPNVLLEALLHRKPVVATRVGGIPEALTGELARFLVPPGEPKSLAVSIIEALKDPDWRLRAGHLGARHVRQEFSPRKRVEQVRLVYEEMLHGGE